MRAKILACVLAIAGCTKEYKVRIELSPAATDRRLATGKSDVVEGFVRSADGSGVQVQVDGELESVPRADVVGIDQKLAKRDVTYGAVAAVAGGVVAIGAVFFFKCDNNDFPLFCAFQSRDNLAAGFAFLGGIVLAGAGLKAVITGKSAQSRIDEIMRGGPHASRWQIVPAIVRGQTTAPGLGLVVGF